jgi:hypothetical protein
MDYTGIIFHCTQLYLFHVSLRENSNSNRIFDEIKNAPLKSSRCTHINLYNNAMQQYRIIRVELNIVKSDRIRWC